MVIEIAGDCLTVAEMKQIYTNATGKKISNFKAPFWLFRILKDEMARQFRWNNEIGWHIDIHNLRQIYPDLISFDSFCKSLPLPKEL